MMNHMFLGQLGPETCQDLPQESSRLVRQGGRIRFTGQNSHAE